MINIVYNRKKDRFSFKTFGELEEGDEFLFHNMYCIKTVEIKRKVNAINLKNGFLCVFSDNDKVVPLDAELTVSDKKDE